MTKLKTILFQKWKEIRETAIVKIIAITTFLTVSTVLFLLIAPSLIGALTVVFTKYNFQTGFSNSFAFFSIITMLGVILLCSSMNRAFIYAIPIALGIVFGLTNLLDRTQETFIYNIAVNIKGNLIDTFKLPTVSTSLIQVYLPLFCGLILTYLSLAYFNWNDKLSFTWKNKKIKEENKNDKNNINNP